MCNVAGFIGQRQAAPVLLEMLSRQEGLERRHQQYLAA